MALKLAKELRRIVGKDAVLDRPEDLMLYEYDGGVDRGSPDVVCFPHTTEQVSQIMKLATRLGVAIVPRGAGTGLSGGSIAREGGIVIGFSRMNKILEVDLENQRAVVQPGVVNLDLTKAVERHGFYFAPDPSSQKARTAPRRNSTQRSTTGCAASPAPASPIVTKLTSGAASRKPPFSG